VGRTQITGGIAENPDDHEHAVQAVLEHARGFGLNVRGVMASPVTGEAGNREYLCWLSPTAEENPPEWGQEIHRLTHP
jgi:23S rRNA (cytidine1920-2'-O)/16S rRNA (cytidine1409-2'-O)-methyltransferase